MYAIALLLWLITSNFDRERKIMHWFTQLWGAIYIRSVPTWKITIEGKENINKKQVYIMVANHQSQFDILSSSLLFTHFKWISKSEVFKIPIVGWAMRLNRYIELKRGDRQSVIRMVKDSVNNIKRGNSIFIFPEGTRSDTGELRKFKSGAFIIAKRTKTPILPIVINGTRDILPKGTLFLNPTGHIHYRILPAINYEEYKNMDTDEIATMVRNKISEALKS
jgi:1-acyl-sn-glycerol-3-phosphate acyltransferase